MSYRSRREGFADSSRWNRDNGYDSNRGGWRGYHCGGSGYDSYGGRGGGSYRGSRGTARGGNGGWWSNNSPSHGDSSYHSMNRHSSNNDRYASIQNDDYRRYKESGRRGSLGDSDIGGYSRFGDDSGRSKSSSAPDDYRFRSVSPRYSGRPNRRMGARGFRVGNISGTKGRSSASVSYRRSFGGNAGLIKRKRLESHASLWHTTTVGIGYNVAYRRMNTVKRTNTRDHDDYRARKIAEFRAKIWQHRERQRSTSVDDKETVKKEVKDEESNNDGEGERQKYNEEEKEKSPKKKKLITKNDVKIVKNNIKEQNLNSDSSRSSSENKSSLRENENNLLDSRNEPFVKLACSCCGVTCKTFREYEVHLSKMRHHSAMSSLNRKRKWELSVFRKKQRDEQNKIDKIGNEQYLKAKNNYCGLCKLYFLQPKSVHLSSILHKKIKQFLLPNCNVCHLMFKSPMVYEHHLLSINHLKKVHVYGIQTKQMAVPSADVADGDIDMENYFVLDSVGSSDDEGLEEGDNVQDSKDETDESNKEKKSESKKELSLGKEFCKKVEVYYCELCKINLAPCDDVELQLNLHCRNRIHLQRYVHHCEKKNLEKIHQNNRRSKIK